MHFMFNIMLNGANFFTDYFIHYIDNYYAGHLLFKLQQ